MYGASILWSVRRLSILLPTLPLLTSAPAACTVVDLNQVGRPDIACIDSSSRLNWYEDKWDRPPTQFQSNGCLTVLGEACRDTPQTRD